MEITTTWEAIDNTPYQNYTFFVHVIDSASRLVMQSDGQPQDERMPTNMWLLGEKVSDYRSLDISSLTDDEYRVTIGWYEWESGERLSLANSVENATELASFTR